MGWEIEAHMPSILQPAVGGGGAGTARHFPKGCPKEQNETVPEYAGQHFLLAGSVLKRQRAVGEVRRNVLLKDG